MAVAIPACQQLISIVLQTYATVLFKTTGFGGSASLMSVVITGMVNLLATFVSVFTVDRVGGARCSWRAACRCW
jgi:MFS transporter, SP family, sugar:H+ symporter